MNTTLQIPLHDFHARHGARFVPFGGWNMPVQYSSILEEHKAVRSTAGLFDVSHMGEFEVSGPDAGNYLDRLVVNAVADAPVGKAVYSPMCAEDGGVVDDLIVYRTGDASFLVCVNASNVKKDFDWFTQQLGEWGLDATVRDRSEAYALLAVQGPAAPGIVEEAGLREAGALKRFRHRELSLGGTTVRACRTGYTGEDGFEIYIPAENAEAVAEKLVAVGETAGMRLCGLGARDSLRLEAGLPLYGHELSESITPLEAGLGWTVKFKKDNFVGKAALLAQHEKGVPRRVIHFRLEERRIAREGTSVLDASGNPVGEVLSGTKSPILGCPIGSAIVEAASAEGPLYVELRGHRPALEIATPPLHKRR